MLLTSRGCPFNCSFCSERVFWGGIWRGRSAKKIVEEMEIMKSKFRKKFVWFADDTFNIVRKRNEDLCDELIERDLDMEWAFEGRADLILRDQDLLEKMVKSGLFWVLIGVEFFSNSELQAYRKGSKHEDVEHAFKELKKYDVVTQAMFIVGTSKDTRESIKEKLKFAKRLKPFFVIFSPLTPLPGTEVLNEAKENHRIEVQDFSKYDFAHAIMRTETLSSEEVDALILECYNQFYGISRLCSLFSLNKHKRGLTRYLLGLMLKERIKNWFSWPKEFQTTP
ncbi:MAG: radical SAM protein [archaeon]|nr:radical SAM protein [archaeon]